MSQMAWTVVPGDARALTIRSYQNGDDVHAAFVVVPLASDAAADYKALFEQERALLDRAMEALNHVAVFPGWNQLRQDYYNSRGRLLEEQT